MVDASHKHGRSFPQQPINEVEDGHVLVKVTSLAEFSLVEEENRAQVKRMLVHYGVR